MSPPSPTLSVSTIYVDDDAAPTYSALPSRGSWRTLYTIDKDAPGRPPIAQYGPPAPATTSCQLVPVRGVRPVPHSSLTLEEALIEVAHYGGYLPSPCAYVRTLLLRDPLDAEGLVLKKRCYEGANMEQLLKNLKEEKGCKEAQLVNAARHFVETGRYAVQRDPLMRATLAGEKSGQEDEQMEEVVQICGETRSEALRTSGFEEKCQASSSTKGKAKMKSPARKEQPASKRKAAQPVANPPATKRRPQPATFERASEGAFNGTRRRTQQVAAKPVEASNTDSVATSEAPCERLLMLCKAADYVRGYNLHVTEGRRRDPFNHWKSLTTGETWNEPKPLDERRLLRDQDECTVAACQSRISQGIKNFPLNGLSMPSALELNEQARWLETVLSSKK